MKNKQKMQEFHHPGLIYWITFRHSMEGKRGVPKQSGEFYITMYVLHITRNGQSTLAKGEKNMTSWEQRMSDRNDPKPFLQKVLGL